LDIADPNGGEKNENNKFYR